MRRRTRGPPPRRTRRSASAGTSPSPLATVRFFFALRETPTPRSSAPPPPAPNAAKTNNHRRRRSSAVRGGVRALVFWKGEKGYPTADDDDANTREDAPPTGPVRGGTDGAGDRRRGGVCVGRATAAAEESRLASIAAETPPRTRRTQSCGSNRTTRARSPHTHTERYVHTSRTHGPAEKLERCNTRDVTVHTHTNTH